MHREREEDAAFWTVVQTAKLGRMGGKKRGLIPPALSGSATTVGTEAASTLDRHGPLP